MTVARRRDIGDPVEGVAGDLIRTRPVIGRPEMSVRQAAELMTERAQDYLLVPWSAGGYAVVTDADIRARVVAAGRDATTPVAQVVAERAFTVRDHTPAVEALTELLERELTIIPVLAADGEVLGVVSQADFVAAPAGASMGLRHQIARSRTEAELVDHARRTPSLIADLVRRSRPVHEITRVLSLTNDAIARRGLDLVLDRHPELDRAALTWLSLGSNARREPVLSSDVDSAASLADSTTSNELDGFRAAFTEVDVVLRRAGLRIDTNGAVASMPLFARTHDGWRSAARTWIDDPLANKGMIFASLMLDARVLVGPRDSAAAETMLTDLRSNPRTLGLLLAESLATRARMRSMRDVLTRRGDTFDIKTHAITPVVNIARWAALSVSSAEVDTRSRLQTASGSELLPDEQASTLVEVFDVLQRIRLSYQVAQFDQGEHIGDELSMKHLSPLDRSLLGQAVREIAGIQRRMANMSHYVPIAAGEADH
ncbi:putative nucleotidyltransferase substrate binding domain-containing protein [Gordonia sp. ABSL1-1]|uniref:putative nucleotidyltransferase substrate binding domain-containing protein n=1 Tax=Gordonia sp. ABSL1-1 TaxID=3053923 RepID=UPI002573BA3D|nr:putative nucleotidyltransferase substrate binding domain-containing protein [Gordonia sp. ABSL1-1]MDL9936316.1 putative nucleotidyltransferase substrate binding domain-containing protein [Gordonia sp. ABSL1-1]